MVTTVHAWCEDGGYVPECSTCTCGEKACDFQPGMDAAVNAAVVGFLAVILDLGFEGFGLFAAIKEKAPLIKAYVMCKLLYGFLYIIFLIFQAATPPEFMKFQMAVQQVRNTLHPPC